MEAHSQPLAQSPPEPPRSSLQRARLLASSALAAVLGLAPHVLHHAGPLAGAALFAGAAGSLLFGALGLLAAVPLLLRVRRRTGAWRRPLGMLALFAAVFSVSTFVVGPALTAGDDERPARPAGTPAPAGEPDHERHHDDDSRVR